MNNWKAKIPDKCKNCGHLMITYNKHRWERDGKCSQQCLTISRRCNCTKPELEQIDKKILKGIDWI